MSVRSFGEWKAEVITFLMQVRPESEEMKRQLDTVIDVFHTLRSRWLSTGLVYLRRFCDYWGVKLPPELLPTKDELARWFKVEA